MVEIRRDIHRHPEIGRNEVRTSALIRKKQMCIRDRARRHPEYYRLAGSDTHQSGDEARAGVILPERPADSFAYKTLIGQHRFHLWSPEFQSFVDTDEEMRKEKQK